MKKNRPKILIISSANPLKGPGTGALKLYDILRTAGIEVDLLTKYKVPNHPEILSVYNRYENERTLFDKLKSLYQRVYNRLFFKQKTGFFFFYKKETTPPVSVSKVIKKINKEYDLVHVYFWQGLLSFKTINVIYERLHCIFRFACADYSIMSGGCHFTGDCQKYRTGCGACPAIYSKKTNDFTAFNVKYRRKVLDKVKPIVAVNNYMKDEFFINSYLYKDYPRMICSSPVLDLDVFYQMDNSNLRKIYNINDNKTFICLFGSQNLNDERKGISYLLKSIRVFYDALTPQQRDSVLLLLAGKNIEEIKDQLLFDYKYLGYVSTEKLPEIYSISNVFLSPSINDAGPSMIIQSLACGTPVVAYYMGYAIDFVNNKNTGYCAKLCDADDFAHGINKIYNMDESEYVSMRKRCRKLMEETTSHSTYVDSYLKIYEKYKEYN